MELHSESVLRRRRFGPCECPCKMPGHCDPAHIFAVGSGRVDADFNVISLSRLCHARSHQGLSPTKAEMLAIAAKRCKTSIAAIYEAVHYIRSLDKDGNVVKDMPLSDEARRLVDAALANRGPVPVRLKKKIPGRALPKYIPAKVRREMKGKR